MANVTRRQVITAGGAVAAGAAIGVSISQQAKPAAKAAVAPVVVIGGGMAGATVAKYIRLWSAKSIPVTIIESEVDYTSNIMSNLVLTGQKTLASLHYPYTTLKSATYGVTVVRGTATTVNAGAQTVTYQPPTGLPVTLAYSRLVMAPGIDYLPFTLTGTPANKAKVVSAWKAGAETQSLRNQLVAMNVDDKYILTIPKSPYRCPPGPYERAALVADWIKKNKRSVGNASAQVIVLDANPFIQAELNNFTNAFNVVHAGVVQYVPNATLVSVDADAGTVVTTAGTFTGKVINVIPDHTAGKIARDAGLANKPTAAGGAFCEVDVLSYESKVTPLIHVLGDASATTQPKAGHVASQEAKVCADAIVRLMSSPALPLDQAPITNSACYSPITATTASWLSVVFHYDPITQTMVKAAGQPIEAPSISAGNFSQMNTWFSVLMGDVFK